MCYVQNLVGVVNYINQFMYFLRNMVVVVKSLIFGNDRNYILQSLTEKFTFEHSLSFYISASQELTSKSLLQDPKQTLSVIQ